MTDYVAPPETIASWADCLAHSNALWHYVYSMDAQLEKHEKRIKELEETITQLIDNQVELRTEVFDL